MKLEKRGDSSPAEPVEDTEPKGKKPVVVYIMILFIAAFLLMAWSFASHQRSNTEALGRLQSSVTAMQEVQDLQDQIIALQRELAEAQKTIEELNDMNASQQSVLTDLENRATALEWFGALQQLYSTGDYAACRQVIQDFETNRYVDYLSHTPEGSVFCPEDRYQQLKEAVEAHDAETSEKN